MARLSLYGIVLLDMALSSPSWHVLKAHANNPCVCTGLGVQSSLCLTLWPCHVRLSMLRLQGPRCSLRSGNMYSDASPDYIKMTALNIPAAVGVSGSLNLALSSVLLVPACCSFLLSCYISSNVFKQQLLAVFVPAHPILS